MMRRLLLWLAVSVLMLQMAVLQCAAANLHAELTPWTLRPRTGAPCLVTLKLTNAGSGLVEGAVELQLSGDITYTIPDCVLNSGVTQWDLLLPVRFAGELQVRLRFLPRNSDPIAIQLGGAPEFRFPWSRQKQGTVLVSYGSADPAEIRTAAKWQLLETKDLNWKNSPVSELAPVRCVAERLPQDSLFYTAFNIVLLEGLAVDELNQKQKTALREWVRGGGAICFIPRADISEEARSYINSFFGEEITREGKWKIAQQGLGRALMVPTGQEETKDESTRELLATFWNADKSGNSLEAWESVSAKAARQNLTTPDETLEKILFNKSVQVVPVGLIALILGCVVIVVGPIDYFLLGRLRKRRLTWVTFPSVCAIATVTISYLAESYLSRNSVGSKLVIVDIARDGRVVRETSSQGVFTGRTQNYQFDCNRCLVAPAGQPNYNYRGTRQRQEMHIHGRHPARFTVNQPLDKWVRRINRTQSFADREDDSGIDWDQLSKLLDYSSHVEVYSAFGDAPAGVILGGKVMRERRVAHSDLSLLPFMLTYHKDDEWAMRYYADRSTLAVQAPGIGTWSDVVLLNARRSIPPIAAVMRRQGGDTYIYRKFLSP